MSRFCFVDETIDNNIGVTCIALVTSILENFKTFKLIDKFVNNIFAKIKNKNIRNIAKNYWKSQHVRMNDYKFKEIKKLIVKSEIHEIKKYKNSNGKNELENRKRALKKLLSKIKANLFIIDNYSNKKYKA